MRARSLFVGLFEVAAGSFVEEDIFDSIAANLSLKEDRSATRVAARDVLFLHSTIRSDSIVLIFDMNSSVVMETLS